MINKLMLNLILVLFILVSFSLTAQKTKIEITDLSIENNKLVIDYDILKSKKNQTFDVWIEITTSTGEKINASSYSGDYGSDVLGGVGKKIVWDYDTDGIVLNDNINVEVKANISMTGIGMGKALLLSAVWPGLGLSKIDRGKPYWILGLVGYGAIAASVGLNKSAVKSYNDYLDPKYYNPNDAQRLINQAKTADMISKVSAYSAIGIWTINLIWTAVKAGKSTTSTAFKMNRKRTLFYTGIDPKTKTVGFTFKYSF